MTEGMERPENLDVHAKIFGNANDEQPGFALYARWAKVLEGRAAEAEALHIAQNIDGDDYCQHCCGDSWPCRELLILRGEGK